VEVKGNTLTIVVGEYTYPFNYKKAINEREIEWFKKFELDLNRQYEDFKVRFKGQTTEQVVMMLLLKMVMNTRAELESNETNEDNIKIEKLVSALDAFLNNNNP